MIETLAPPRFGGTVYLVNPRHETVGDEPCYHSLRELPETVDLAVTKTVDDGDPFEFQVSDLAVQQN